MFSEPPRKETLTLYARTAGTQVCGLCVGACLVSWGSLLAGAVIHLLLSSALHERKTAACPPLSLCFFHLSFPCGTGQSREINRNKLSAPQAEPRLQERRRRQEEKRGKRRRDGAGQVEPCKQELIWQLEAAHMANHQHKFEIGNWNLLLCKTRPVFMLIEDYHMLYIHKHMVWTESWQRTNLMTARTEK